MKSNSADHHDNCQINTDRLLANSNGPLGEPLDRRMPARVGQAGVEFVLCCLQMDPARRPTCEQLLQHGYIQSARMSQFVRGTASQPSGGGALNFAAAATPPAAAQRTSAALGGGHQYPGASNNSSSNSSTSPPLHLSQQKNQQKTPYPTQSQAAAAAKNSLIPKQVERGTATNARRTLAAAAAADQLEQSAQAHSTEGKASSQAGDAPTRRGSTMLPVASNRLNNGTQAQRQPADQGRLNKRKLPPVALGGNGGGLSPVGWSPIGPPSMVRTDRDPHHHGHYENSAAESGARSRQERQVGTPMASLERLSNKRLDQFADNSPLRANTYRKAAQGNGQLAGSHQTPGENKRPTAQRGQNAAKAPSEKRTQTRRAQQQQQRHQQSSSPAAVNGSTQPESNNNNADSFLPNVQL